MVSPALQRIMAAQFARWQFKHPKPQDFFAVANETARRYGMRDSTFGDRMMTASVAASGSVRYVTCLPKYTCDACSTPMICTAPFCPR